MSRRSRLRTPPVYLAGWLFADMLLVLTIVALGGEVPPRQPVAGPTSTAPTTPASQSPTTPSPTPTPTPSPTPTRLGLDPDSTTLTYSDLNPAAITGSTDSPQFKALRNAIANDVSRKFPGKTAALVIVWGTADSPGDSGGGQAMALAVAKTLPGINANFFPAYSDKIIRHYWSENDPSDTVELELFFIV